MFKMSVWLALLFFFVFIVQVLGIILYKNGNYCTNPICTLGERSLYLIGKYVDKDFVYIDPFPKRIQVGYSQNRDGKFVVYSVYARVTSYSFNQDKGELMIGFKTKNGQSLNTTVDTSKVHVATRYTSYGEKVDVVSLVKRGTYILVSWTNDVDNKVRILDDNEKFSGWVDSNMAGGIAIVKSF